MSQGYGVESTARNNYPDAPPAVKSVHGGLCRALDRIGELERKSAELADRISGPIPQSINKSAEKLDRQPSLSQLSEDIERGLNSVMEQLARASASL